MAIPAGAANQKEKTALMDRETADDPCIKEGLRNSFSGVNHEKVQVQFQDQAE